MTVTANTLSDLDAALKQLYVDSNEAEMFYDERVGFGLVNKDEMFGGRNTPVVVTYGRTGGVSPTFATAQTISALRSKKIEDFLLTGVDEYSIIDVPGKTFAYTRSRDMAWDMLVSSMAARALDDAEANLADAIEHAIFRDGSGVIAQIKTVLAATATTTQVDFTEPDAAMLFELNERFNSVAAASRFGADIANSNLYCSAIDVANNKVTFTEVVAGTDDVSNWDATTNPYIRQDGAAPSSATEATRIKLSGLMSWAPTTAPTGGDSYFNVDRSASSRLYGKYIDYSGLSREQALIRASAVLAKEGGMPNVGLMGISPFRGLIEELGLRKQDVDMNPVGARGLVANIAYRGVWVHGVNGSPIRIMPAAKQIGDEVWMGRMEDVTLHSAGPALNLEDYDGLSILRHATEDAYQGRMAFRGQLSVKKPGRSGRFKLQAS